MPENPTEHLGDGAYISYDGFDFFITNQHYPREATDVIVLDQRAMVSLLSFVSKIQQT